MSYPDLTELKEEIFLFAQPFKDIIKEKVNNHILTVEYHIEYMLTRQIVTFDIFNLNLKEFNCCVKILMMGKNWYI